MKQIQTSFVPGLEVEVTGELKVSIVIRADKALKLLKLSRELKKPMTKLVSEAIINYFN